jgi:hypothetical protein
MKEFIVMSILALGVGLVLLILAILFLVQKKGGRIVVYPTLLLFPVLLIAFPNLFLSYNTKELFGNVFVAVPRVVYSTIILVFIIFVILKENISPQIGIKHANASASSRKTIAGMRLLEYSAVANVIYIAPIVLGIVYSVHTAMQTPQHATGNYALDMFKGIFVWALILFVPAAQYYAMVVVLFIYFGALAILMLATSINGVVRVTTAGDKYSKLTGLFIVLMFVPVVNIIFMLLLCYLGNRELKMIGGI